MASPKNVYWDSCVWLSLIKEEPGRVERCRYVLDEAKAGRIQIWTSAFTLAEVFKITLDQQPVRLPETKDVEFEQFIEQDFVTVVQVDQDVGVLARRLLRKHQALKKSTDAIHLATAVLYNLDEFHTFDVVNLVTLSGTVARADAVDLPIHFPPEQPPPPPMPLFDQPRDDDPGK